MRKNCNFCEKELDSLLPFKCRYCGELFCNDHYLPENHRCSKLPPPRSLIKHPHKPLIEPDVEEIKVPTLETETIQESDVDTEPKAKTKEKMEKQKKPERRKTIKEYLNFLPKIHLSNTAKIFYVALIVFLILHLILMAISSKEIWIIYIIALCIAEIAGLLWLLFKLDRISIHTNLRLWGLKILAGIIFFCGMCLFVLILFSAMIVFIFSPFFVHSDQTMMLLQSLPIYIPALGLTGIGAYLEFKFRRGSGIIVYRG